MGSEKRLNMQSLIHVLQRCYFHDLNL
uniref:Uncharacterized protein n=1 Tax=Rhizophora mucronata TaxID=61149 RepID=A0A2P2QTC1_RHIMU